MNRSPVPAGGSTAVTHLSNLGPGAALPSEATCATAANASAFPETNSLNVNDGTGWDANSQIFTTPSYFYSDAGGSTIGFSNSDFANVDGKYSGSTQDILRWVACKQGADEDWVYAEAQEESTWANNCAKMHGGSTCNEGGDCYIPDASEPGTAFESIAALTFNVTDASGNFIGNAGLTSPLCASWGILQSKVAYAEWYTWPMIAISTAWGADYRFAKFRGCMNGDSAKVSYFTSQNSSSGSDYSSAISRATSSPNAVVPGGLFGPSNVLTSETNLQYLALGCIATHFSGDWYGSQALCYLNNNRGSGTGCSGFTTANFVNILNTHSWPGGLL